MSKKIAIGLALLVLAGCGLGQALTTAGAEYEQYSACVFNQIEIMSARYSGELALEKATVFVVSACKPQEDVYVVAMTDLAMTLTGSMVSRKKFLEDEEAALRSDLHDMAAGLVAQNL